MPICDGSKRTGQIGETIQVDFFGLPFIKEARIKNFKFKLNQNSQGSSPYPKQQ